MCFILFLETFYLVFLQLFFQFYYLFLWFLIAFYNISYIPLVYLIYFSNLIPSVFVIECGVLTLFSSFLLSFQILPSLSTFSLISCAIQFIILLLFFYNMFFQYSIILVSFCEVLVEYSFLYIWRIFSAL